MSLQYSTAVRNAKLDAVEVAVGVTPKLQIRSGAPPANCAAVDSGSLLAEFDLPSDWMAVAASGTKAKSGTWSVAAAAGGTAAHFRVKDSTGVSTHAQGTVTATGGGGDMTVDNTSIALGQVVTVSAFTLTSGNA